MSTDQVFYGCNIADVLAMSGAERYKLLLRAVNDYSALWIAESDDHVLTLHTDANEELLPVWPTADFVTLSLTAEERGAGYRPTERTIKDWIARSTPALIREGVLVGAFPNAFGHCPTIDPRLFKQHIANTAMPAQLQATDLRKLKHKRRRTKP